MSELVFMMGKYEARIPADRMYARNHMWGQRAEESGAWRFGRFPQARANNSDRCNGRGSIRPPMPALRGDDDA